MAEAVARNGVAFNMGANALLSRLRPVAERSPVGAGKLQTLIIYGGWPLSTPAHTSWTWVRAHRRRDPVWAQGSLLRATRLRGDDKEPWSKTASEGMIGFANGVTVHVLRTSLPGEIQAICEAGCHVTTTASSCTGAKGRARG